MTVIELDERGRAPLRRLARPEDTTFLVEVRPNGQIVLTPAVTISKDQQTLNAHPEILAAIDESFAGVTLRRPRPQRRRS